MPEPPSEEDYGEEEENYLKATNKSRSGSDTGRVSFANAPPATRAVDTSRTYPSHADSGRMRSHNAGLNASGHASSSHVKDWACKLRDRVR
jgi:hypothetical protein